MDETLLREFALIGARQRLIELDAERERIYASFPELRPEPHNLPFTPDPAARVNKPAKRGGTGNRRRMTAAQRALVSVRMRDYWKRRRAS